jgi:gluconokinase
MGERAPIYDPEARGIFFGIGIHHTKRHFQRALIEGICFEVKWIMETVEEVLGKKKRVIVSGGIMRSSTWMQILSDVLNRELRVSIDVDASVAGAAKLGFTTLGIEYTTPKTNSVMFNPRTDVNAVYEDHYKVFKQLYSRVKDLKLS